MSRRRRPSTNRQGVSSPPPGQTPEQIKAQRKWYRVDLHLHSPASHDFEEPKVTYLDWLQTAATCDLDVVAITDHNTVAGVAAIRKEIEWLISLEAVDRLTKEERERLGSWRELSDRVLVLPGFEFTATFGFHILAIFPPETTVRQLEHTLLMLSVPADKLDAGSTETGATTDVLTAYQIIHDAGGLVIAAHANSTHGVAMRNFPFGGQTKIAYTQDPNLDALEVTDLDSHTRSSARFFNGSKPEYARRMHCIQGSDAHRLTQDAKNPKRLGIGDRGTEMLLETPNFEAIRNVLRSKQFDRTRPTRPADKPFDPLAAARDEGASIVLSFHESESQRGGRLTTILNDICAFANTVGGTIFVGASQRKGIPKGLPQPRQTEKLLQDSLDERLKPPLAVRFDVIQSEDVNVLRLQVPKGPDRPYCIDDFRFYVRDEAETTLAVRDEIVALVRDALEDSPRRPRREEAPAAEVEQTQPRQRPPRPERADRPPAETAVKASAAPVPDAQDAFYLPQIGVEIVESEERHGSQYHSIRDLRNGHIIKNVTRKGARKLWNYAIQQHEDDPVDVAKVQWRGAVGLVRSAKRVGKIRYDLALRENGAVRVFYGVTEDGMEGLWAAFVQEE